MTIKFRHPERSEGSPITGTVPRSGDPSSNSGLRLNFVILSVVKDLPLQAPHHVQEIPHCIRDDVEISSS
ncbi:hypothetical protein [Legionella quateirensis]|uniref:Uncharacterized protein n=1 Tax=Legionella quateirensis TaxID=45072 RepID=A0ABR5RRA9_9GAMM|nr:hypothetical protein [Legionella quateirensis]KTD47673.1 hypothetical protein Lqua_2066 [Legionella quateirensis]